MDPAATALPPAVWGIVRVPSAGTLPGEGERQRAGGRGSEGEGERQRAGGRGFLLREGEGLAGLLAVVDAGTRPATGGGVTTVAVGASATTARALAAAIRVTPSAADAVAWLEGELPPPGTIARLVARLGTRDAVVVATPISDAVKRVRDGMIVGDVARDGLCRPRAPVLIRIRAARERLLPALDDGHDLFEAIGVAGCTVTVVAPGALTPG